MTHYQQVVIETYLGTTTHASGGLRARPVPGQGYPFDMHVEWSMTMRRSQPVGTRFLIQARVTAKDGKPCLYCYYGHGYKVLAPSNGDGLLSPSDPHGDPPADGPYRRAVKL